MKDTKNKHTTSRNGNNENATKDVNSAFILADSSQVYPGTSAMMIINEDDCDSFTFSSFTDSAEVSYETEDAFYKVEESDQGAVIISSDEGVTLTGEAVEYSVYQPIDHGEYDMFYSCGKTADDSTIHYTDSEFIVTGNMTESTVGALYHESIPQTFETVSDTENFRIQLRAVSPEAMDSRMTKSKESASFFQNVMYVVSGFSHNLRNGILDFFRGLTT